MHEGDTQRLHSTFKLQQQQCVFGTLGLQHFVCIRMPTEAVFVVRLPSCVGFDSCGHFDLANRSFSRKARQSKLHVPPARCSRVAEALEPRKESHTSSVPGVPNNLCASVDCKKTLFTSRWFCHEATSGLSHAPTVPHDHINKCDHLGHVLVGETHSECGLESFNYLCTDTTWKIWWLHTGLSSKQCAGPPHPSTEESTHNQHGNTNLKKKQPRTIEQHRECVTAASWVANCNKPSGSTRSVPHGDGPTEAQPCLDARVGADRAEIRWSCLLGPRDERRSFQHDHHGLRTPCDGEVHQQVQKQPHPSQNVDFARHICVTQRAV